MSNTIDWRENYRSVKQKLKRILEENDIKNDVVFSVGVGTDVVKAHSFMLRVASQKFEKLLNKDDEDDEDNEVFKEIQITNEDAKGVKTIEIPNVNPKALDFMLKNIYYDFVDLTDQDAIDILSASIKFRLFDLASDCINKLMKEITTENVLRLYEEATKIGAIKDASKLNIDGLIRSSHQFILNNAREVVQLPEFLSLSEERLCEILKSDDLQIDEVSLFKAMKSWGENNSNGDKSIVNLRSVLKKVKRLIRYTLMTLHDMATVVYPSKILDDHEILEILIYLILKTTTIAVPPKWIDSNNERRNEHPNPSNPSTPSSSGVNPETNRRNYKKEKQLEYLRGISEEKTISGIFLEYKFRIDTDSEEFRNINSITGLFPAIVSLGMPKHFDADNSDWNYFIVKVISTWKNSHLVSIHWNDGNPLTSMKLFDATNDEAEVESRWECLMEDGALQNRVWKEKLDSIAPYLRKLQNKGIVTIFNIFPLMNNKKYIWRGRPGENGTVKLYKLTHDYLTQQHYLTSLIWTWSLDGTQMNQVEQYWPGKEYVDVVSVYMEDIKELPVNDYLSLVNIVGDIPMSMESMRTVPTLEYLAEQPKWTWFTAADVHLKNESHNDVISVRKTFNHSSVINRGNVALFHAGKLETGL